MDDKQELDDTLANLTDQIIDGKDDLDMSLGLEDEVQTLRLLHQFIKSDEIVDTQFRKKLSTRLNAEWDKTQRQQIKKRLIPFHRRYARQLAASAAAVLIITVAALSLLDSGSSGTPNTVATAEGDLPIELVFVFAIGLIVFAIYFYYKNKK